MDYLFISAIIIFQVCFFVQLYSLVVVHKKLSSYSSDDQLPEVKNPASVIICAKNELRNLEKNLVHVLEQDYPDFEVVVVNDCSNDASDLFLRDISKKYPHLKVLTIDEHPRFKHGKKFALTLGIKASKHENLIFTDADCRPASNQWISRMQNNFQAETEIVLGYSPYELRPGLLNMFIRYETFFTALNYLSFALAGNPYMGVGRNMCYKKSLFFKGKGFASHMHILSGDDDLFVNQNATTSNTRIEIHPESHVWTEPKKSFSSFMIQKLRHQGAGKAYKKEHKRILINMAISGVFFYLSLFALIALDAQWWLISSVYLARLIVQLVIYAPVLKKLRYADLVWWLPVLDFLYYLYLITVTGLHMFKKKVEWK